MKNRIIFILTFLFYTIGNLSYSLSNDDFNFDAIEIEILENGNRIVGKKGGEISTPDGLSIIANSFELDRAKNILEATGNVKIIDKINDYKIFSEKVIYFKFENKIFSSGYTDLEIKSKYIINAEDVFLEREKKIINSKKRVTIKDIIKFNFYELDNFNLDTSNEILKGNNIILISKYNEVLNDKLYFENGIYDLKNNKFASKNPKILLRKDIFDENDNDPRIIGKSIIGDEKIIKINKASFTSCKDLDKCPPWYIEAKQITHDREKKQINYNDAVLKIFDLPVLYFPKFFHPDPSVERQSGFLQPEINNSNILGSSIGIPYFKDISEDKDITFKTTIFDEDVKMFQNEYRSSKENSNLIIDMAYVDGYQSSLGTNKNTLSHLFVKYLSNLNFKNFDESSLNLTIEKTSNDTYLKIFEPNISKNKSTPGDQNILNSNIELRLKDKNNTFTSGFKSFENLQLKNNDRYQYILPYYNFNREILNIPQLGYLNFLSTGSNELNNTNSVKTKIINDFNFTSKDYFSKQGFKNRLNIYTKNLNTIGKKYTNYKSSPQIEIMNLFEFSSSYPLVKYEEKINNYFTPLMSLRWNPGDMKNYNNAESNMSVSNVFNLNRLAIDDSFEKGKSLTFGLEYKKENLENINNFFETKLATVLRDKKEDFIPTKSSLGEKQSDIFGSITYQNNETINFKYDYALDKNLNRFLSNSATIDLNFEFFETKFSFIEKNGNFGSANTLENSTKVKFNDQNFLTFNTRRNREINLTEYYNLIYEYQNDCLTAGIKYSKNYYQDRDLKPVENLFFTITLFPLTTFEQKVNQ